MNPLECHGTLTTLGCGCLVETTYNVIVEKHPACENKEHQYHHKSYRKAFRDKKAQMPIELKGRADDNP